MVRDLRDEGAGAITSEGRTSSWLGRAHTMKQMDRALLKLAQAERSGDASALQKAYEELFWLCCENHLDPKVFLPEAEVCQPVEVALKEARSRGCRGR
jgi:hypothetical protein